MKTAVVKMLKKIRVSSIYKADIHKANFMDKKTEKTRKKRLHFFDRCVIFMELWHDSCEA